MSNHNIYIHTHTIQTIENQLDMGHMINSTSFMVTMIYGTHDIHMIKPCKCHLYQAGLSTFRRQFSGLLGETAEDGLGTLGAQGNMDTWKIVDT